jgi:hypothetical protein
MLPVIADVGVDIVEIVGNADKDDIKPLLRMVADAIKKNPNDIASVVEARVKQFYSDIADMLLKHLRELVKDIKAGKVDKCPNKQLPDGEIGFDIDATDPLALYTTIGRDRLVRQDYKPLDDIKGTVVKRYLSPVIKPMLEKLMDEGFFDDIANGYFRIALYKDPEALAERIVDANMLAEKAKAVEADLAKLEKSDFTGNADLLEKTVKLYCDPNGIIAIIIVIIIVIARFRSAAPCAQCFNGVFIARFRKALHRILRPLLLHVIIDIANEDVAPFAIVKLVISVDEVACSLFKILFSRVEAAFQERKDAIGIFIRDDPIRVAI